MGLKIPTQSLFRVVESGGEFSFKTRIPIILEWSLTQEYAKKLFYFIVMFLFPSRFSVLQIFFEYKSSPNAWVKAINQLLHPIKRLFPCQMYKYLLRKSSHPALIHTPIDPCSAWTG
jgi:hypothetical protein